ncbi:MAG: SUMF1/EgtB/PvdO family nonheme iron enzyme [Gemmataceae bacterium]|nr:SUMF1/EgtB/PvdO family nonheme iron enzyme [Gemmataceae bacterium]
MVNPRQAIQPPAAPDSEARRVAILIEALVGKLDPSTGSDAESPHSIHDAGADDLPRRIGSYELLKLLGAGGMGSVYKARHIHLDKTVALKILSADRVQRTMVRTRFRQEMKAVGRLAHPHIVQAFDAEVEGVPYLAMELIEGTDLSRLAQALGPLPIADACELARQAALGLQHAHEHGLVHRDIKPSNLMLTREGSVKVLDLGLARLFDESPTEGTMTAAGCFMGTPDYAAPEQMLDSHQVDIRADIYSLGCTLYQLLSGQAPFTGPPYPGLAEKRRAHLTESPRPLRECRPGVPPLLAAVVERMLAKTPAARYQTPAEAAAALQPFCHGSRTTQLLRACNEAPATQSRTALNVNPRGSKPRGWFRTGRRSSIAAAVGLGLIGAGILWMQTGSQRTTPTAPDFEQLPSYTGPKFERLPGRHYIVNSVDLVFVQIPAGTFTMGSPKSEQGREPYPEADETQHEVEITRPFYLGIFEVTQEQYAKILVDNPSFFSPARHAQVRALGMDTRHWPAESVSWPNATRFCEVLSSQEGEKQARRTYRLPTEAEWEYACRGGAMVYSVFHFGNTLTSDLANFGTVPYPAGAPVGPYRDRTTTVGSFNPNGFGLYDMHGNVWEWCSDRFGAYNLDARRDPTGSATGNFRVIRGGGWDSVGYLCRAASRGAFDPAEHRPGFGFRVVCVEGK